MSGSADAASPPTTLTRDAEQCPSSALDTSCLEVSSALDGFLDSLVLYTCVGRDVKLSRWAVNQALQHRLYTEGLSDKHVNYTGGMLDGMPSEVCNDQDMLITHSSYPTVLLTLPKKGSVPQTNGYVIGVSNPQQPAHLLLRVTNRSLLTSAIITCVVSNTFSDIELLSSELFVSMACRKANVYEPVAKELGFQDNSELGRVDKVYCLLSPSWPQCAGGAISRPRPHGWPSRTLLNKIKQKGCHVVGVGHYSSEMRDLEWMWSFSVAEKDLLQDIDDAMAACLCVLQTIIKSTWPNSESSSDEQQVICFYCLKTAVLWIAEDTAPSLNTSVMELVRNALDWLAQSYKRKRLPHYFIPEQNLIAHLPQNSCDAIAKSLEVIKNELCLHVLCTIIQDRHVEKVIKTIHCQLEIPLVSKKEHYKVLLKSLLECNQSTKVKVLEEARDSLSPGSRAFLQASRRVVRYWTADQSSVVYTTTMDNIKNTSPSELIKIPESIVQSVIDNIDSILKSEVRDTFVASLFRQLGDVYHSLYLHYKKDDHKRTAIPDEINDECYQKAERYYMNGLHLPYPDGWTDKGLSGFVHLAKFHYLNGEWDKVAAVIDHLRPLLENIAKSPDTVNALPEILVRRDCELWRRPWQEDSLLCRRLIIKRRDPVVHINPAVLGHYIHGRYALRQGRMTLYHKTVKCMQLTKAVLDSNEHRNTATILIDDLFEKLKQYSLYTKKT